MDSAVWERQWREIFECHTASLLTELSAHFHSALRDAATHEDRSSRAEARRETAENLNQTIRRLRQTCTREDAFALLADSTSSYCRRAAVFTVNADSAISTATRGFVGSKFHIGLPDAAAFRSAIESKDPVVASASPNEVSSALFEAVVDDQGEAANDGANASVYLFPLVVRQAVLGLLFASGEVQAAPLELLSEATA
ncbi:MAG: hypothetical protein M3Y07_17575, partial [Acidobacteriota bacterium]|nr:hypothetical protein [Acidobacteriota bacterium]